MYFNERRTTNTYVGDDGDDDDSDNKDEDEGDDIGYQRNVRNNNAVNRQKLRKK